MIKKIILALFVCMCIGACSDSDSTTDVSVDNNSNQVVDKVEDDETNQVADNSENGTSENDEQDTEITNKISTIEHTSTVKFTLSDIPAYSDKLYVTLNDNVPSFSKAELKTVGYETYSDLDSLGRTQTAIASVGKDTMPKDGEERKSISSIKPSGWVQAKYDHVSGKYLYNRCHLIGWQLSAENANKKNLITGTRTFNTQGMLPFENMVADYIKETGNHIAYRITPFYKGNNLVCTGVQMEAYSVEDNGEGIEFNVFVYNVEKDVEIDYATGKSKSTKKETSSSSDKSSTSNKSSSKSNSNKSTSSQNNENSAMVYIPKSGKKYHSNPNCSNMKNPSSVTQSEAVSRGYEPCKKCY